MELYGYDQLAQNDIDISSFPDNPESQYEVSEEINLPDHDQNITFRNEPISIDITGATFDEVFDGESTENLQLVESNTSQLGGEPVNGGLLAKIWGLITSSGGVTKYSDNSNNIMEKALCIF